MAWHTIEIRDIQAPGVAGFSDLFVYADQTKPNQAGRAGQIMTVTITPAKTYVKGELSYTCEPKGVLPSDVVLCRAFADGTQQADVAAGAPGAMMLNLTVPSEFHILDRACSLGYMPSIMEAVSLKPHGSPGRLIVSVQTRRVRPSWQFERHGVKS